MAFISSFVPLIGLRPHSSVPLSHRSFRPSPPRHACPARLPISCVERSKVADTPRKQFLEELKSLGNTRLIARNDTAIMESIATWDTLFFANVRSNEYANLIDHGLNLDLHLVLDGISGAIFETGVSRTPSKDPTYIIRLLGPDREQVILSVFLQWDKIPSDISEERVKAWHTIRDTYLTDVSSSNKFFFD